MRAWYTFLAISYLGMPGSVFMRALLLIFFKVTEEFIFPILECILLLDHFCSQHCPASDSWLLGCSDCPVNVFLFFLWALLFYGCWSHSQSGSFSCGRQNASWQHQVSMLAKRKRDHLSSIVTYQISPSFHAGKIAGVASVHLHSLYCSWAGQHLITSPCH